MTPEDQLKETLEHYDRMLKAVRRRSQWQRRVSIGCGIMLLIAVSLAWWGWLIYRTRAARVFPPAIERR